MFSARDTLAKRWEFDFDDQCGLGHRLVNNLQIDLKQLGTQQRGVGGGDRCREPQLIMVIGLSGVQFGL